jgi:CheY-like chemotaxis protein
MNDAIHNDLPVILIVEDIEEIFETTKILLRKEYKVIGSSTVEGALVQLETNAVNLILMDINLKQPLDGINLAQNIKADERFKNIPIVAFTAYSLEYESMNLESIGMDDLILKPASKNELITIIKRNLKS